MTSRDRVFVDSNVLLYLTDNSSSIKKQKAEDFLSDDFIISTQVIAENINVCLRKIKLDKSTTFNFARKLLTRFEIVLITPQILLKSFDISTRYQVNSWVAIILATVIKYKCTILYSDDMQEGLIVEGTLTIVNPFNLISSNQ
jgi:predicted nucleic acid-binding protein